MRSKAPLAMMEQAVMVLVFALAAVLCLRVFVWSDRTSELGAAKDMAVIKAQSAAEIIKNEGKSGGSEAEVLKAVAERLGGAYRDGCLTVGYLSDWQVASDSEPAYSLSVTPANFSGERLSAVHIEVTERSGELLFELDAAWQREAN